MATAGAMVRERAAGPSPGAGPLRAAVWLSAARCTLTYVVAPALASVGAVRALVGPVAVWLHLIATGCVWAGARRMWHSPRATRRGRVAYGGLAVVVTFVSVVGIARAL